jgi:hypothetical protein
MSALGRSHLQFNHARILYMRQDIANYLRALWKHWVALASGIGSLVLSAILAHFKVSLPERAFWIMALVCFFIASFRAWRDGQATLQSCQAENERLRTPRYASEQFELVRGLYEKADQNRKALLREIRVRGFMLEPQATSFYQDRTGQRTVGILFGLQYDTNLICKLSGDQYQINPSMQEALDKVLEADSAAK